MREGDRVTIVATGESGVVKSTEWVLGERDDLWSEHQINVQLDGQPFEVAVSERALVPEDA